MMPGFSRNCRRTSNTTAPAARLTALTARPENRKTTAAPSTTPTSVFARDDLVGEGDGQRTGLLPHLDERGTHRIGVGPEQRGRREYGCRDGDALGDRLGGVAHRVQLGEDLRAVAVDIARHLGDALRVVRYRAERVHRDDDADRRQQAGPGDGDEEQRDDDGPAAEQERAVDGGTDHESGIDSRLESSAMPDRITVAGPVSEVRATSWTGRLSVPVK